MRGHLESFNGKSQTDAMMPPAISLANTSQLKFKVRAELSWKSTYHGVHAAGWQTGKLLPY